MGPQLTTVSILLLTFFVNTQQTPYTPDDPECPPYFSGSIAGDACSQEYSICVSGVRQAAACTDGYVFYETGCVPVEESPECQLSNDETTTFDCSGKADGDYSLGCTNEFVQCANGIAYTMYCPAELVYDEKTLECQETCEETSTTDASEEVYDEAVAVETSSEAASTTSTTAYEVPGEEEDEESIEFDCAGLEDGIYADGCSNYFYECTNSAAFKRICPEGTVYNPSQKACDYDCETHTTTQTYEPITSTTTEADVPSTTQEYTTTPAEDVPSTTTTTSGYYPASDAPVTTTTSGYYSEPASDAPVTVTTTTTTSTTTSYYDAPASDASVTTSTTGYTAPASDEPVTIATTTTSGYYTSPPASDAPVTVTTSTSGYYTSPPASDAPVTVTTSTSGYYTSPPASDAPVTIATSTSGYYTSPPASDAPITITTDTPTVCQEGQITTFGTCSSRFTRCQNNAVRSKQCPVNTLFETSLLLCVFDLPQCQPVAAVFGSQPNIVVSPFDDDVQLRPHQIRRPGAASALIDNPFFVPPAPGQYRPIPRRRFRGRRVLRGPAIDSPFPSAFRRGPSLDDDFSDYRKVRQDRLQYGSARRVDGNRRFLVADSFTGPHARFVTSNTDQVFPINEKDRSEIGPVEDPDGYEDGSGFDPKDLFGATRRKRSAGYGYGYQSPTPQVSARQAQVNQDCRQYTVPTYLTFGNCFDQFIYCSGNGINRLAACPLGESFDKSTAKCSETCGVTVSTQTAADDSSNTGYYTTAAPAQDTGNGGYYTNAPVSDAPVTIPTTTSAYYTAPPASDAPVITTTSGYYAAPASDAPSTTTGYYPASDAPVTTTTSGYYSAPASDAPVTVTTSSPVENRCANVAFGFYAVGCSQTYVRCLNGAATVHRCPAQLYFDERTVSCRFQNLALGCQQVATTTQAPAQDVPTTSGYYQAPSDDQTATTTSGYYQAPSDDQTSSTTSGYYQVPSDDETTTSGYTTEPSDDQTSSTTSGYYQVPSDDETTSTTTTGYYSVPSEDEPSTTTTGYYPTDAPSDDQPSSTTTSAPIGNRCSQVASGLFAIGCSQKFIQCSNGAAVIRQCPATLYFDEKTATCNFADLVASCQYAPPADDTASTTSGYGNTTPAEDQQSTSTSGYSQSPSDDETTTSGYVNVPADDEPSSTTTQRPSTYAPSVAPYNPISVTEDVCAGLSDGSHGQGCSSSYIVCSNGRLLNSVTCPLGEGFDPSVQYCRSFDVIPDAACDQTETTTDAGLVQPLPYVTLENVLSSTTTQAPTTTTTTTVAAEDVPEETTTTNYYGLPDDSQPETTTYLSQDETSTVNLYGTPEEEDDDVEEACEVGTRASVGFCVKTYLECSNAGTFVEKACRLGKLFDAHANKCVVRGACGKEDIKKAIQDVISATTTTISPKKIDGRCAHVDGEATFALGSCSANYVRCSYGSAVLQHCSGAHVFSNAAQECVSRDSVVECQLKQSAPVKSFYNNGQQDAYCDGKADGLYGNKRDCSAILQCFGGELFEHQPCPPTLAFNELTGKCDYPQKVSGCESYGADNDNSQGSCSEHGAYLADVSNCSVFYRCVWGRRVTMRCPSGTVFNPLLSVCDWPSAVPSCSAAGLVGDDDAGYTGY